nr:polysaccharide pyruvyl transferase family protein [Halomonas sp. UBA3074]
MKLSILTQPLGRNYGGLLQAYALQITLKRLGCDVETLNRYKPLSHKQKIRSAIKSPIRKVLGLLGIARFRKKKINPYVNLERFKNESILVSPLIDSDRKLFSYYSKNHFDALVVGSDQVWRPRYSPKLSNFFLDFCDKLNLKAKRIAYAASFGVDDKEFSAEEVALCRPLVQKFDAISVREISGIDLLKDYFNVSSDLVFDPTLLLDYKDYEHVIENDATCIESSKGVMAYVLDMNAKKQALISKVSKITGEKASYLMNKPSTKLEKNSIQSHVHPSVGDWLNNFRLAKFVVTDSFHGCVFSIIFNKPFLVIGNKSRGLARFTSLLKTFELEDRLVESTDDLDNSVVVKPIDWKRVNEIRQIGKNKSINFITKSLSITDSSTIH